MMRFVLSALLCVLCAASPAFAAPKLLTLQPDDVEQIASLLFDDIVSTASAKTHSEKDGVWITHQTSVAYDFPGTENDDATGPFESRILLVTNENRLIPRAVFQEGLPDTRRADVSEVVVETRVKSHDCHPCGAFLGKALLSRDKDATTGKNVWQVIGPVDYFAEAGSFGAFNGEVKLLDIGKTHAALAVTSGFTNMGSAISNHQFFSFDEEKRFAPLFNASFDTTEETEVTYATDKKSGGDYYPIVFTLTQYEIGGDGTRKQKNVITERYVKTGSGFPFYTKK